MILGMACEYAEKMLKDNGIEEADFKALCVCCHIDGIKNRDLILHKNDDISDEQLNNMLERLVYGEPLQYVIGKWDFYESEFCVGEGVLIPRPETEELVELAVNYVKTLGNCVVYDLCAGSGCIGLSIAKACTKSKVILIEKSLEAFKYLQINAKGIENVEVICADINDDFDLDTADVIISNPPYIKSSDISSLQSEVLREPVMALDGGNDGLDFYRLINNKWSKKLKPKGRLFLEIGNEQGKDILSVLNNFENIEVLKDIYGNDRMVKADRSI